MQITLLTHSRELVKTTGTGPIVKKVLSDKCHIIEWQRKIPDKIFASLDPLKTALVYPIKETAKWPISELTDAQLPNIEHFVILDGTWQEAQKMYHRSPYLHGLPHYAIRSQHRSEYQLRRNQKSVGLCTAEVVIEILRSKKCTELASLLHQRFTAFNQF